VAAELTPTHYVITAPHGRPIEGPCPRLARLLLPFDRTPGSPNQSNRGRHRRVPDASRAGGLGAGAERSVGGDGPPRSRRGPVGAPGVAQPGDGQANPTG